MPRKTIISVLFLLFSGSFVASGGDHNLDYYLTKGLSNSPAIKDLSNQIRLNRCDSLITRATYLPQVNFNAQMMYAPVINDWGFSEVITNGQVLQGTLNVNQQIFNKKTREANLKQYGLESQNLNNSLIISKNELKKAITAQYLAAYSAMLESRVQQEVLATLDNEAEILKKWVAEGIYRQNDYLSFRVEIMSLERSIRELDIQYRNEFRNLNIICGINDTTLYELTLPSIPEIISLNTASSPLFRRFLIDSLRIQNEKQILDRKYKPQISWFSDGGLINNEPQYIYQNFGISFGLSMTLPVYDGNQRSMNYERLRTREETRKNYQEYFRFQYDSEIRQLKEQLEKIRTADRENEKRIALITELIQQDQALLTIGSMSVTDYVLALKSLIEAKHTSLLYRLKTQYIINEINFWQQ